MHSKVILNQSKSKALILSSNKEDTPILVDLDDSFDESKLSETDFFANICYLMQFNLTYLGDLKGASKASLTALISEPKAAFA